MYPEPYFPADEDRRSQDEIRRLGFTSDPLLDRLDTPVLGFNVAVHWPLPEAFAAEYEGLRADLAALDDGVYVYPLAQTHVTLATLVSFKRYENPTAEDRRRLRDLLPYLVGVLEHESAGLRPFVLEIGAPVLVRTAAFLPLLNPGGEVARLRGRLAERLRGGDAELAHAAFPRGIHSTILRFRRPPRAPERFQKDFIERAQRVRFGPTTIDTLLLTSETRPYMVSGAIEHRSALTHDPA
jgi:hypothetical protein